MSKKLFSYFLLFAVNILKSAALLTHIVGDEVKLRCDLITDPEGKIVWKAGSRVLFAGDLRIRRDRRLSLDNNDLVISRVGVGDGGDYSCETETLGGDVLMMVTYLEILSPSSVHILGGEGVVTVKSGASLKLTCKGEGVPVPQVTWWRNDSIITTSVGKATIELDSVNQRDAGGITCMADNGVGDVAEETVTVHVLASPTIILSTSTHECFLQLECSAHASPQAALSWWYNGLLLNTDIIKSEMISSTSSIFIKLDICGLENVGEYVCEAENRWGMDRKNYQLTRAVILGLKREREQFNFIFYQALPLVSFSNKDWLGNSVILVLLIVYLQARFV